MVEGGGGGGEEEESIRDMREGERDQGAAERRGLCQVLVLEEIQPSLKPRRYTPSKAL